MRKWKVIDEGMIPDGARAHLIPYMCVNCWRESELPVVGTVLAQIDEGLVFDTGRHHTPDEIKCPWCRRTLDRGEGS